MTYLLSGALHRYFDLDVTNPTGSPAVWTIGDKTDGSQTSAIIDHHCHGCFAVSVPIPPQQPATLMEPKPAIFMPSAALMAATARGLDPPPPKSLT
ncbi:MAG: hypothetical protein M9932_01230 [Xanthobacteraceae bacterium]|nr:hypothetical protein [Xanthobacteraceae bacterium]